MSDSTNGSAPVEPAVTEAAAFRRGREQGELITLPTGRVVRMRVVRPAALLRLGKIPDPLTDLVLGILYGKMTNEEYDKFFALAERKEHALDMIESLRVVCTAALIEPRVVEEVAGDGEILIDDLEDSEQRFIFDLALLEATALSRFRERQAADVGVVEADADATSAAEPVV